MNTPKSEFSSHRGSLPLCWVPLWLLGALGVGFCAALENDAKARLKPARAGVLGTVWHCDSKGVLTEAILTHDILVGMYMSYVRDWRAFLVTESFGVPG